MLGRPTTHGMYRSAEYRAWQSMRARCYCTTSVLFLNYGGRGIAVCERWRTDFPAFFADVGARPTAEHSLDRIDNDGHYEPGNCRWATRAEQSRNTRANVWIEVDGVRRVAADWARLCGISHPLLIHRLKCGWSERDAVLTPCRGKRPSRQAVA